MDESYQPPYLHSYSLKIAKSTDKGRGIYATATQDISPGIVIEISPVLLFNKDEYEQHGRHTLLDHYTFNWPNGKMALALGVGSLFNHSDNPNVSFAIDTSTETIRYTVSRAVKQGEELNIFYGHNLWFQPAGVSSIGSDAIATTGPTNEWLLMNSIMNDQNPFTEGKPADILSEQELPFQRTKVTPNDEEEDEIGSIKTMKVWVADIPEPKAITTLLKWLKTEGFETPELAHLKRIKRQGSKSTLLLTGASSPPPDMETLGLSVPYQTDVPTSSALTMKSLQLKLQLWPTVYAPRRKYEVEPWTRAHAAWAWDAVKYIKEAAETAKACGELPIVSYVPLPFVGPNPVTKEPESRMPAILAMDSRQSSAHPLRHSVINAIRKVAEWRATISSSSDENLDRGTPTEIVPTENFGEAGDNMRTNGTHYLLTSLTLFTTHEPCVMCSMALLHSRVKEVIFLRPMDATGGCGGHDGRSSCVPRLKGVNHRFNIYRWKLDDLGDWDPPLSIAEDIDA